MGGGVYVTKLRLVTLDSNLTDEMQSQRKKYELLTACNNYVERKRYGLHKSVSSTLD